MPAPVQDWFAQNAPSAAPAPAGQDWFAQYAPDNAITPAEADAPDPADIPAPNLPPTPSVVPAPQRLPAVFPNSPTLDLSAAQPSPFNLPPKQQQRPPISGGPIGSLPPVTGASQATPPKLPDQQQPPLGQMQKVSAALTPQLSGGTLPPSPAAPSPTHGGTPYGPQDIPSPQPLPGTPNDRFRGAVSEGLNMHPDLPMPDNTGVVSGITRGLEKTVQGAITPGNASLALVTAGMSAPIQRLIAGGFSVKMLTDAYQQVPQVKKAIDEGDYGKAAELATETIGTLVMGAAAGKHALTGGTSVAAPGAATPAMPVQAEPVPQVDVRQKVLDTAAGNGSFGMTMLRRATGAPYDELQTILDSLVSDNTLQVARNRGGGKVYHLSREPIPSPPAESAAPPVASPEVPATGEAAPQQAPEIAQSVPAEAPAPTIQEIRTVEPPKAEVSEPHKFASTQVNLPEDIAPAQKAAAAAIPDADLAEDGRELEPHITALYGLDANDASGVAKALQGEGPIKARIGKTSIFENPDFDVVKMDIDSPDLHRLNKKLTDEVGAPGNTHPKYEPHVTLAYVKKGLGQKYDGKEIPGLTGKEVTFNSLDFSGKDRTHTEIPLQSSSDNQYGRDARVYTPRETSIDTKYRVIPADQLRTSFDQDYAQYLQPRNTDRAGSRQRIEEVKGGLNPEKMGESVNAGDGSPIVLPDGQVVTRNHGTQALRELYEVDHPNSQRYKEWLQENASRFGLNPEQVAGTQKPVLVREIQGQMTPAALQKFAEEANMSTTARMSDAEQAQMLAKRIRGPVMDAFNPREDGTPNPEFVQGLMAELPAGEQAAFIDKNGQLSQNGIRQIRNAIFAKAYPETSAIERMAESTDNGVRNVSNGMLAAAPRVAQLQEAIARGDRHPLGIEVEAARAAETIDALRESGTPVENWLSQDNMFGRDPVVDKLVQVFSEHKRSGSRIGDLLKTYTEMVDQIGDPKQESLFGQQETPTRVDILEAANQVVRERNAANEAAGKTGELFPQEQPASSAKTSSDVPAGESETGKQADAVVAAKARVRKRLAERGSLSNKPTEDTASMMEDLHAVGRSIRESASTLREWSKQMVSELGEAVKGHLLRTWKAIHSDERGSFSNKPSPSYDKTRSNFVDKMNLAGEEKDNFQDVLDEWERDHPEREVVSFDDIRKEAAAIDPALVRELKPPRPGETLNPAVRHAAQSTLNGINERIYEMNKELSEMPEIGNEDRKLAMAKQIDELRKGANQLVDVLIPTRSQDGRNLVYWRMEAQKSFDPTYWIGRATREAGGALPEETKSKINEILEQGRAAEIEAEREIRGGKAAPETAIPEKGSREDLMEQAVQRNLQRLRDKADGVPPKEPGERALTADEREQVRSDPRVRAARLALARQMMQIQKSSLLETVTALRKAGLMGIRTHMRNLGGNAGFQVLEEVSRVPRAATDIAMSLFTKQRTVQGISPEAIIEASRTAATKGVQEAKEIIKHGDALHELGQFEQHRELNSGSKLVDAWVNYNFRVLGAEDRLFRVYAYQRSLAEQMALQKAEQPTEAMRVQAIADAEYSTFNNKNVISTAWNRGVGSLKQEGGAPGKAAAFAAEAVVPFVRTPTNILARLLDYTPAGASVRIGHAAIKSLVDKDFTPVQQRAIANAMGRGATGAALIYLGWQMAAKGHATGTSEYDSGAKNVSEAAGRLPGAVQLGDGKWRQISQFSPEGNLITLGATLQRESTRGLKNELKRPLNLAKVATDTALQQPMLQGASNLIDALKEPGSAAENFAGSTVGSFIPTVVSDMAAAADTKRRDTRGEGLLDSIKKAAINRTPGARNTLPARKDVFGKEEKQNGFAVLDPTIGSEAKEQSDPVLREIVARGLKISKITEAKNPTVETINGREVKKGFKESPEELQLRNDITGQLMYKVLARVVQSEGYQQLPDAKNDDARKIRLEKAIQAVRTPSGDYGLNLSKMVNAAGWAALSKDQRIQRLKAILTRVAQ